MTKIVQAQGSDFQTVVSRAGELSGYECGSGDQARKAAATGQGQKLGLFWAVLALGLVGTSVAKKLGMSQSAVSKAVQRGGKLAADKGYTLSGERKL